MIRRSGASSLWIFLMVTSDIRVGFVWILVAVIRITFNLTPLTLPLLSS